jgi:hypothetical protein
VVGVALATLAGGRAEAGTGSGPIAAATFIHSRFPDNNDGGCGFITVGRDGIGGLMRGLVRFTLPSPIPPLQGRIDVTGVVVTMTITNLPGGTPGTAETYTLEPLGQAFAQGAGCGAQVQTTRHAGVACTTGASWNKPECSLATTWTTAGGGAGGMPSTSTLTGATVTWDSGAGGTSCAGQSALCTTVASWIDTGIALGWRIRNTEANNGHAQSFTKAGSLAFHFACKAGFADTGTSCTSCTSVAKAACVDTAPGNACNDLDLPGSTAYACACAASGYKAGPGATSCVPACTPSTCTPHDPGATCTDTTTGYSCACSDGFVFDGTTCISACGGATDPCGNGGTCTASGGGWTCSCPPGYVSDGAAQAVCTSFDACDAAAMSACVTTATGNTCVDEAPPSMTYHCACDNAAFVVGAGTDGRAACVDKGECTPNHCADGGDVGAACTDHAAPAAGYDCACGAGWRFDGTTCVDVDECAAANPCDHGTCSNTAGDYTCTCDGGYTATSGAAPTCVVATTPPSGCCSSEAGPGGVVAPMVLVWALPIVARRRKRRA